MPEKEVVSEAQTIVASGGFAWLCGWLSYLLSVQEGKSFKWSEFFLHGAISGTFGLIAFELLSYEGFPANVCGALSGVAGWGGTRFIKLLLRKKFGVSKEELDK